jgi:hypothetical protein
MTGVARAELAPSPSPSPLPLPSPSPEPSPSPDHASSPVLAPPWLSTPTGRGPLGEAEEKFDFGRYEDVVALLRPLVESGGQQLPRKADRVEALRIYGIACTLTRREQAAEAAFLLLLREEPRTRLDAALVPDEAVRFFDKVRERYRAELVAAYRKNRGHRYWFLNLLPPIGQFQNRQWRKGLGLGAAELALLAADLTTGLLLQRWEGADHTFKNHRQAASELMPLNWISFAGLISVFVYGVVDGLVVNRRLDREERRAADKLFTRAPAWRLGADGLAVRF